MDDIVVTTAIHIPLPKAIAILRARENLPTGKSIHEARAETIQTHLTSEAAKLAKS